MKTKEGLWKLSPSGLYSFEECKACFWVANHIGRHPFTLPLRLNDAMDEKLKTRYDFFRAQGMVPPEVRVLKGITLFQDLEQLNEWRTRKNALRYVNESDGYTLEGKIDELFVNQKGEFVPADYKSSGDPPKQDKQKYYRFQLHGYALMFSEKGYKVADEAYLLHYFTKDRKDTSLAMEFDFHADKVAIDLTAFRTTLRSMVQLLEMPFPGVQEECKKCAWLEKRKQQ